ncbi:MAG: class I SAM-dependent methyltransferase [Thermoanaerobaculia bacterium]|nr:class I SAM-dependent methyltransferase [Thermoanaerobaculia bacterium]
MPGHAFDAVARGYDAGFTDLRLGRWLRRRVQDELAGAFPTGSHVLELGCGTGEDAIWLAQRGLRVTATDASAAMLEHARSKAEARAVGDAIRFEHLDLRALDAIPSEAGLEELVFDGAFSDFGALNCVRERRSLGAWLAPRVRSGGRLVLVVMGPLCPWEILGHLARARPGRALRRLRPGRPARLAPGAEIEVWYPSPRRLRRELAPWFRPAGLRGLGSLLPPTDFAAWVDRRPRLFSRLASWDRRVAPFFPATWLADHYVALFERRSMGQPR